jgi:prevent-host-death family protein
MTQYKRYGQMLVVEPLPRLVEEVPMRELARDASGVFGRVRKGTRAVVTKRGAPIAVILEFEEAVGLCGTKILSRREAERRLLGEELDQRLSARRARELARAPDRRPRGS